MTAQSIPLLVTPGYTGDGAFHLRFPPEYRDEILTLLDDHGIDHGTVLEMSSNQDLAIEAVRVLGSARGLAALASFFKTFVNRHQNKRFTLKRDKFRFEIDASGYSAKQTEQFLQQAAAEQAEIDAKWHETLNQMRGEGDQ